MGLLATILLGIVGSIIGGLVGSFIWRSDTGFHPGGLSFHSRGDLRALDMAND